MRRQQDRFGAHAKAYTVPVPIRSACETCPQGAFLRVVLSLLHARDMLAEKVPASQANGLRMATFYSAVAAGEATGRTPLHRAGASRTGQCYFSTKRTIGALPGIYALTWHRKGSP